MGSWAVVIACVRTFDVGTGLNNRTKYIMFVWLSH